MKHLSVITKMPNAEKQSSFNILDIDVICILARVYDPLKGA